MSSKLVLCLDGTWNTYRDHTNVSRLHAMVPNLSGDAGVRQIKYYDEGVGTGRFDRIRGGALGMGLSINIQQAYAWLITHFQEGSELYIFGFSRGAYTARSLAGLIGRCGIAQLGNDDDPEALAKRAYDLYRSSSTADAQSQAFLATQSRATRIHFIGVWDTVQAMLQVFAKFHDTKLGAKVDHAFQALAIDEHRKAYDSVLWTENPGNAELEQRWFAGAHANVGGGYPDDLLPDLSLRWMLEKAFERGLHLGTREGGAIRPEDILPLDEGEFRSPVRDACREMWYGGYALWGLRSPHFRAIGKAINESVDPSVFRKIGAEPNYRPTNLAHAGNTVSIPGVGELAVTPALSASP